MEIFNVTDLSSEFTVIDVVLVLVLSFATSAFIGWIYNKIATVRNRDTE